jgi:hypothetical protein
VSLPSLRALLARFLSTWASARVNWGFFYPDFLGWPAGLCQRARVAGGNDQLTELAFRSNGKLGRIDLGSPVSEPARRFGDAIHKAMAVLARAMPPPALRPSVMNP